MFLMLSPPLQLTTLTMYLFRRLLSYREIGGLATLSESARLSMCELLQTVHRHKFPLFQDQMSLLYLNFKGRSNAFPLLATRVCVFQRKLLAVRSARLSFAITS